MQSTTAYRWDDIRMFLALQREGSLSAAAARLGIDVSTTSRRLVALEEALGVRLFDRARDGLLATSAAEQLLVHAEEAERGMTNLAMAASGFDERVEGTVRITAPPGLIEIFLAPLLATLHKLHPRLVIDLDSSQQVLDLSRREADIAIRTVRPEGAQLIMTKLVTTRYVPLTSAAYARSLAKQKGATPKWIVWGDAYARIPPARWLTRHVDVGDVVLKTSSMSAQIAAAQSGLGIALLPENLAARFALVRPSLPRKVPLNELPAEDTWLVGHRALRGVPRVAAVWEFIRSQAKPA
jgi:DNA-binding transcriptional LysR family regulator